MYYELKISQYGKHLFSINERSALFSWQAYKLYKILKNKFPESENFNITIIHWEELGTIIEDPETLK